MGTTWGLLSGGYQTIFPGDSMPLGWPPLIGRQVFYSLGIPAVSPVYFYTLGVAIWGLMFYAVGLLLDILWLAKLGGGKNSQRPRMLGRR
ncbi:MAG: hypothetical protein KGZ53_07095 [Peptococcaceae bacterium]|nr:hypothetical protein [Peptococcaceae bacterium]